MKKRVIKDITTGKWFKATNIEVYQCVGWVNSLTQSSRYSMSQGDSEAIARTITNLQQLLPTHEFVVEIIEKPISRWVVVDVK